MDKKLSFDYEHFDSLKEMSEQDRILVEKAKQACDTAYAPYSDFHVGAAALLQSGAVITGSNQESEVFPAGICAERNLLFYHQAHHPQDHIIALAIASMPDKRECYPCGICRQVLNDVEKRQGTPIRVIMSGSDSATVIDSTRKLLPFLFEL